MKSSKYLKLLQRVIKTDSYTNNYKGVNSVSKIISSEIEKAGFTKTIIKKSKKPDLIVLHSKRVDKTKPVLLISGHVDTVLPFAQVNYGEDNEWIYGSGANDMKGGLVSLVYGLQNLNPENVKNIIVTLTPDEERGSQTYNKELKKFYRSADYALVLEGKGSDKWELCPTRRGIGLIEVETIGKEGHSGHFANKYPNAIEEMASLLSKISKIVDPKEGLTINFGKIEGGMASNIVAAKCSSSLDVRFNSESQFETVKSKLEFFAKEKLYRDSKINYSIKKIFPPMQMNKKTEDLIEIIKNAYQKLNLPLVLHHRNSASDGNFISSLGLGIVDGFGTFGEGVHTKDEKVLKESIEKCGEIIKETILSFETKLEI